MKNKTTKILCGAVLLLCTAVMAFLTLDNAYSKPVIGGVSIHTILFSFRQIIFSLKGILVSAAGILSLIVLIVLSVRKDPGLSGQS